MGHACGCTESTATAKEEISQSEPKSKYQQAPSLQNRPANSQNTTPTDSKDYKSKTQQ